MVKILPALLAIIMDAKCQTACEYNGYAHGRAERKYCVCEDWYLQEDLLGKKYQFGGWPKSDKPVIQYSDPAPLWHKPNYDLDPLGEP